MFDKYGFDKYVPIFPESRGFLPVPREVAVCPDCGGELELDIADLAEECEPFLPQADLWTPGYQGFALLCKHGLVSNDCEFALLWKDGLISNDYPGYRAAHGAVSKWLKTVPFLIQVGTPNLQDWDRN